MPYQVDLVTGVQQLAQHGDAATINGQALVKTNAQPLIASALRLAVGAAPWCTGSSGTLANAAIRSFAYYPRRLTNAQLQTMTT